MAKQTAKGRASAKVANRAKTAAAQKKPAKAAPSKKPAARPVATKAKEAHARAEARPAMARGDDALRARLATELLSLEESLRKSGDRLAWERWTDIILELFARGPAEQRRGIRLQSGSTAVLRAGATTIEGELRDVSHFGLNVVLQGPTPLAEGAVVELEAIRRGPTLLPVGLRCGVIRVQMDEGRVDVGLSIRSDQSVAIRRRFFEEIYYPAYLEALRRMAAVKVK